MKTFESSVTGEMKFLIGFLVFVWIFGTLVSLDNNGFREAINISILTLLFCVAFGYGWIKQTYLVIDDNKIKFVNFLIDRKTANIPDIKIVTTSMVAGFIKFLCIIHYPNGREKLLQISPVSFSKQALNEFVSELKKINPQIEIHKSTEEFLISKPRKGLTPYQITGLIGTIISGILIFIGISYGNIGILGLLIPLGGFLGVFSIGYSMKGKLKDALRLVFYFLIFSLIVIVINFLR